MKRLIGILTTFMMVISTVGCANKQTETKIEKNGSVVILYTSDIHCGIDQGFGIEGLEQIREGYEAKGYATILVDDGDAIQGETVGSLTEGEAIIDCMNAVKYDVAIPGNHEFDYGLDRFLELTEKADYPYISCNFNKEGELVLEPYVIKEAGDMKIAFVGITTPKSLTSSTPTYFQNEEGDFIYGFMQDETGEKLFNAVQTAVDDARSEGADYVYVMAHIGEDEDEFPYTYAEIISHTNGIDVFLDGHSHDTDQVVMQNKDGDDVIRSAVGTKLNSVGYSIITPEDGITETNILSWPNEIGAPELLGINNSVTPVVNQIKSDLEDQLNEEIATSQFDLTIIDPVETNAQGNPVTIIRHQETNLGDLCTDAFRYAGNADISMLGSGGIRTSIPKGTITFGNIVNVMPYRNNLCVIEVTGQQVLDALEWGCRILPNNHGCFLQVSGMTYDIDVSIPTPCISDDNGMFVSIEGERRIKNVKVNGEPIDPAKTYTIASTDYLLLNDGDGYTMFEDSEILDIESILDTQVMVNYLKDGLNGEIPEAYSNPYGEGRITILNGE